MGYTTILTYERRPHESRGRRVRHQLHANQQRTTFVICRILCRRVAITQPRCQPESPRFVEHLNLMIKGVATRGHELMQPTNHLCLLQVGQAMLAFVSRYGRDGERITRLPSRRSTMMARPLRNALPHSSRCRGRASGRLMWSRVLYGRLSDVCPATARGIVGYGALNW